MECKPGALPSMRDLPAQEKVQVPTKAPPRAAKPISARAGGPESFPLESDVDDLDDSSGFVSPRCTSSRLLAPHTTFLL